MKKEAARQHRRKKQLEIKSAKWYDPQFEKRFSKISMKYVGRFMFGYFIFDFLACAPVFFYEMFDGFTTDYERKQEQINSRGYKVVVFFKVFKLLMLSRISQSLSFIEDSIKDVFVRKKL